MSGNKNLELYNKLRTVPQNAQKEIQAGRLKGKTDINPMWRIKALTEALGPCGFGWRYEITDKRIEPGVGGEISAFVDINLYIKHDGEWSRAIPGTGGSAFVAKETKGLYQSDECFKMALTDAISVACKALGVGADVYWNKDTSKYDNYPQQAPQPQQPTPPASPFLSPRELTARKQRRAVAGENPQDIPVCEVCGKRISPDVAKKSVEAHGHAFCSKGCARKAGVQI